MGPTATSTDSVTQRRKPRGAENTSIASPLSANEPPKTGQPTTTLITRRPISPFLSSTTSASSGNANSNGRGIDVMTENQNLLDGQLRRDYVLDNEAAESDLGPCVNGSRNTRLTLMDEVVLLGLKDQQGYLSFLNDSISYVLRGCIIMELALRRRIRVARETGHKRSFPDRIIEVIDSSGTDEVLLDEALKLLKQEKQSIATWMDLLSGETWNPLKVTYQLKQVRERIAKGLVDKGVLRTEKHSFLFFDMATHPLSSPAVKEDLARRVRNTCLGRGPVPSLRSIALVCAASTANVLENVLSSVPSSEREASFNRAEEFLRDYANPNERSFNNSSGSLPAANEIVAGVLTVFGRLDSLLY